MLINNSLNEWQIGVANGPFLTVMDSMAIVYQKESLDAS